jgi:hypothetical protein
VWVRSSPTPFDPQKRSKEKELDSEGYQGEVSGAVGRKRSGRRERERHAGGEDGWHRCDSDVNPEMT